jgi:ketol-acid reductoisomerase
VARFYTDADGDSAQLDGRTVAVLGYGNQGRSQALNLRDSGVAVVVGNRSDSYRQAIAADGFEALTVQEAAASAEVVMVLLPDEVHRDVLPEQVFGRLKPGSALVFAHGYSVHFGEVAVPEGCDVCLVAPKMVGPGVRDLYLAGRGFPSLVAVHRDATGSAWPITLAVAKGIGSLRAGAWQTTFEEEAITDLFGEQVGGSGAIVGLFKSFETLVAAGYDPDVVQLELLGSGELVEVVRAQVREGLLNSLKVHSPTSHFGQLYRAQEILQDDDGQDDRLTRIMRELKDGTFASLWRRERDEGYPRMRQLERRLNDHGFLRAETRNRERLQGVLEQEAHRP